MQKFRYTDGMISKSLFSPIHWPAWFLVGVLRVLCFLPYAALMRVGSAMGWLMFHLSSKSKRLARINLDLSFPTETPAWRARVCKRSFLSAGQGLVETALGWWGSARQLQPLCCSVKGAEVVEQALSKGKGVIIIGAHFSTLQVSGRLFALGRPISVVYRRQKIRVFDAMVQQVLKRHYQTPIVREDLRGLLKALKRNEAVWYTPDVDPRNKASIFVNFFGRPASTVTIPANFSNKYDVPIIFSDYKRRDDGKGYDIALFLAPTPLPSGNIEADTQTINDVIESQIREKPEQYLWQYKRFKTQPPGHVNPYKERETQ